MNLDLLEEAKRYPPRSTICLMLEERAMAPAFATLLLHNGNNNKQHRLSPLQPDQPRRPL